MQYTKGATESRQLEDFAYTDDSMRVEHFDFETVYGEVSSRFKITDIEAAVLRLSDPAHAVETIHWGRNYLYRTYLESLDGRLDVVVKQFRNSGLRNRLRRKLGGSKAARSWKIARAFERAGLKTAESVMLIESHQPEGPSFFVTRYLEDVVEARHLLRAANAHEEQAFPHLDYEAFFEALGGAVRRMHEAGFFHRDLSIGNVLLQRETARPVAEDLAIIDLNRARHRQRLSLWQRNRDLCRLAIHRSEQQKLFLCSYWKTSSLVWHQLFLYWVYHYGFRLRIDLKKKIRATIRGLGQYLLPRRAHAHIPKAPDDASARNKIVWDHLSDQPHQHAGRLEKLWVRVADAPSHTRHTAAFIAAVPRIVRSYRRLQRKLYSDPVPWEGVGICVRPIPNASNQLLAAIDDLGVRKVLLRLHPWEEDHDAEEDLARSLVDMGCEVALSLPQNRDLVRDPIRWNQKVTELAERFTPYGRHFQIGQAINRSKWGIWRHSEYLEMAWNAAEALKKFPGVEIMGPAVIDFELHVTAGVLGSRYRDLHFDILAGLLYVDRRGAPEYNQLGFNTVDKVLLQQAIAEASRACSPRSWITEVNWPLWEGPHSPAGKSVSVDPDTQANYLVRYYLLALTSGAVERVYWWQLVARGYGLAFAQASGTGIELICRPSYQALKTLARELEQSTFIRPLAAPRTAYLYLFRGPDGNEIIAGWSSHLRVLASLPAPAKSVVERDGSRSSASPNREIELTGAVRYFHL